MTKTYKQIIDSILESIYKFQIPNDVNIDFEFVGKKIDDINMLLIDESLKAGKLLSGYYTKTCCIEIECEKPSCVINGRTVQSNDVLWKATIPALNERIGWTNILYLGKPDMASPFRRTTLEGFLYSHALEYSRGPVYYTFGNQAYFKNLPTPGISRVCMVAILANPISSCDWTDDTPYPTPDPFKLELRVKQDILSTTGINPDDSLQNERIDIAGNNPDFNKPIYPKPQPGQNE